MKKKKIRFIHHETHTILHFTISPKALWPVKKGKMDEPLTQRRKKNNHLLTERRAKRRREENINKMKNYRKQN